MKYTRYFILMVMIFLSLSYISCQVIMNLSRGIVVKQGARYIAYNTGRYDFGFVTLGESSEKVEFRIENNNPKEIKINAIRLTLGNVADFSVDLSFTSPSIPSKFNTVFAIKFSPVTKGEKFAIVSIETDADEYNPYAFTILGTEYSPDMQVRRDSVNIATGTGVYDFGSINSSEMHKEVTFTIDNLGTQALNLNGTPAISLSGPDANLFLVSQQPSSRTIASKSSLNFIIKFTPNSVGVKTANVTIPNSDINKNPYTFTIKGRMITPDINVKHINTVIPSATGLYDFGNIFAAPKQTVVFTIENSGSANLVLSGNPRVSIIGADSMMFSVITQPNSPVLPGASTNFTVEFAPLNSGQKTAMISIVTNVLNKNPYTFTLRGSTNLVWVDGFENYTPGEWPFVNWVKDGYANYNNFSYVDNVVYYEGAQSLRLYGLAGYAHPWYSGYAHRFSEVITTVDSKFEISLYARNGDETIPATGTQDRVMIFLRRNRHYTFPARQLIRFNKDNNIYVSNNRVRNYNVGTWYNLRIRYERLTEEQVRLTYWLDNNQISQEVVLATTEENSYNTLTIAVGAGTAWFDKVKIYR